MTNNAPLFDPSRNPLFRENYRPLDYKITDADVKITMDPETTIVSNTIKVIHNDQEVPNAGGPLILDGEDLILHSLRILENGKLRDLDPAEYAVTDKNLIIKRPPAGPFTLEITTGIQPSANTSLSGIYTAGDIICSQCEAQGFRRISYFLDRPDNMAKFTVTLAADKTRYPVLLSNGNGDPRATKDIGNGMHEITWVDPWPKPSYLFATVAGDLKVLEDKFTTMSGKEVDLRIYVQPGYEDKIDWAMQSIKRSMKWDEDRYGREYDLDCFHIVAVDKFNAGAMENKGLNIFNVSLLVGDADISTDDELTYIEAVIGHEYFHNYSGDRVTVRDWFELTLKEGLTVLRDRQFTEDTHSKLIKRIDDATDMKSVQFVEDSGPTSHPIRPDRVEEFNNIYTGTIYEKGSHVLGMLHTMMGEATWRAAMDEYFTRFDSQAVTCDDFVNVMEQVSGIDLTQFRRWYSQSGTPEISYSGSYDPAAKTYSLTLTQETPATHDQKVKQNLHIPVSIGLIGQDGKDIPLKLESGDNSAPATMVLHLKDKTQTFVFKNVDGPVVPSILRAFSAPVKIVTQPSDAELAFRMAHDSDGYNKYEATERLMVKTMHKLIADAVAGKPLSLDQDFMNAYGENVKSAARIAADKTGGGDLAFAAMTLQLPAYNIITQDLKTIDPDAVEAASKFMRERLAKNFQREFSRIYADTMQPIDEKYDVVPAQVGRRSLHNLALGFVSQLAAPQALSWPQLQYARATNMTERLAALSIIAKKAPETTAAQALDSFYNRYKSINNVVDKWLQLSAGIPSGDVLGRVRGLMQHEAYDKTNPNKVRSLIGGFISGNPAAFHNKDGSGYKFLADVIIEMNDINPSTATGLARRFTQFNRYDESRQKLMIAEMERLMAAPKMNTGLKEVIGKALESAEKKKAPGKNSGKAAKPD